MIKATYECDVCRFKRTLTLRNHVSVEHELSCDRKRKYGGHKSKPMPCTGTARLTGILSTQGGDQWTTST